ncbi:MAG: hypothetical protein ACYSUI_20075 [Planctomycetota bacterium]|jgi:hypothetical protein
MRLPAACLVTCVLLVPFGVAVAQDCPCWTAEQLAAIPVDPSCTCQNDLLIAIPSERRCTTINVNNATLDRRCIAVAGSGGFVVVRGTDPETQEPFECGRYDPSNPNSYALLTEEEALTCALEIAARGEVAEPPPRCSANDVPCVGNSDCPNPIGLCSASGSICVSGADCPDVGWCTAGGVCENDGDCPGVLNFCLDIQPQSCEFHENVCRPEPDCLNECYPPGCGIRPTLEASETIRIEFTRNWFDVVHGVLSELRADGDFSRHICDGSTSPPQTNPMLPSFFVDGTDIPGDGTYYLLRTREGVSCTDHGDSSLTPDPRDALDASCPP